MMPIAMDARCKLRWMGDLTPEENDRLRVAMLEAYRTIYGKNATEMAKAMKRSQPSMSNLLRGKGGASLETARNFAKLVKRPVWQLLGGDASVAAAGHDLLDCIIRVAVADGADEDVARAVAEELGRGAQAMSAVQLVSYMVARTRQHAQMVPGGPERGLAITEATSKETLPDLEHVKRKRRGR